MPSCFVPYCQPYKTAESSGDEPSFFLPPKDETLFLKWKNALPKRNDDGEELSHTSKVCHRHFLKEQIIRFHKHKILKIGSVPSIFPTSTELEESSEDSQEDLLFIDLNDGSKEKVFQLPSQENVSSAYFHTLKLPSENWTTKYFSVIHNDRPVTNISCYETKLSVEGWPLFGKAAQINFEDNSINYRVSDRPLNPAGYLPVHFNSQRELEFILQRFDRFSPCQGVRDDKVYFTASQSVPSNATFNQGVWRSITCSEIVDLKTPRALAQCDSCRALKRNVLRKRLNPEKDPHPIPKVKFDFQEKQALIKAINRNCDHGHDRLKFKKRIEDLTNMKLNPLQEGVLKGILLDFNK